VAPNDRFLARGINHVNASTPNLSGRLQTLAGGLLLAACAASTGCQIDVAGQTLPSPYHLTDDVQYYAPGPEFKLANEATALAEQRALEMSEPQLEGGPVRAVPAPVVPPEAVVPAPEAPAPGPVAPAAGPAARGPGRAGARR
jgi:hypothetical protein